MEGTQIGFRPVNHSHKKFNDSKKEKKESKGSEKKPLFIKIAIPIRFFHTKIIIEKPQYGFFASVFLLVVLVLSWNVFFRKPQIESISVEYPRLSLRKGDRLDPGIDVSPDGVDKNSLKYTINNPDLVDITQEWLVVGCREWRENDDNTTTITLSGGSAKKVKIFITLEPEYTEKADEEIDVVDNGPGELQPFRDKYGY